MKKFVLILGICLAFSTNAWADDTINKQEFVNPIFYQPLEPLSSTVGWTYLTPKTIDFRTPLDKNLVDSTGRCELVENEQDHITLLCDITWRNEKKRKYYTYVIKDLFMPNCLRVLEYNYRKIEDFSRNEMHAAKYCITPPNYIPSESN